MDLLIDVAVNELLEVVKKAVKKTFACKKSCKRLQKKLEGMLSTLVFNPGEELSEHRQKPLEEFYQALLVGKEMVQECSKVGRLNFLALFKYAGKIEDLNEYIDEFSVTRGWAVNYSELRRMRVNSDAKLENVQLTIETRIEEICSWVIKSQPVLLEDGKMGSTLSIPKLPEFRFGLENSVYELKKRLLHKDVPLLGVVGMGGSGKTTLAIAICHDPEVQGRFKKRIVFGTVSKSPNILELLGRMWVNIVGGGKPNFLSIDDARIQLQGKLCEMEPQPTLVVLDDVWSKSDLEKLTFKREGYTFLITTRYNRIVNHEWLYEKQLLEVSHAVPLFCVSAFGQESIPEKEDANLVMEVIHKCKGLPLALQVIGKSLYDQPPEAWITAKDKLSQGQPISEYHEEELLGCLATSIDILKEDVQECFLDMGIFPEARKLSADPLLDLWVYVHGLNWAEAYTILMELASRNLVKLVNNQKRTLWNSYASNCDLSFIQHDVLRELAIYLTKQEPVIKRRKRFIIPQKDDSTREMWKKHAECQFDAEIVSFNTGSMEEKDWCEMDFPNAKALILNFSADEYFLPPFMQSMHKLEVLFIFNHNARRAALKGTSVLSSLTQLKVVQLEGVTVPLLQEYCQPRQQLQKLSLILCKGFEGFENMTPLHNLFPCLLELTIDHCSNLTKLPASIYQMASLKRLSVTNCHQLEELLDGIENLSSLERLRLSACLKLKELPNSVCKLGKLQVLDISLCQCIEQLPDELGQLSSLKILDMRECSKVKQVPRSAGGIRSLGRVICDDKIQRQWSKIIGSVKVEVAEENFNLDWL